MTKELINNYLHVHNIVNVYLLTFAAVKSPTKVGERDPKGKGHARIVSSRERSDLVSPGPIGLSRGVSASERSFSSSVPRSGRTSTTMPDDPFRKRIQLGDRNGARSPTPNALTDMEPAFFDVQPIKPGLLIWRVERRSLWIIEQHEFGFFHEGSAYIVLHVDDYLETSLHYWIGSSCTERDAKQCEEKASELDRILSGAHIFSREVEQRESTCFMHLFTDGVIYMEGRHKTNPEKAATYGKKLYMVTGANLTRTKCIYPSKEYLTSDSALILDGFPRIYVWIGKKCGYVRRVKTMQIAKRIRNLQRNGKCHIIVIDENDIGLHQAFMKKLDGIPFREDTSTKRMTDATEGHHQKQSIVILHRVSGNSVLYDMPEAAQRPLKHCYLVKKDCYLLDRGPNNTLYVWVGREVAENDLNKAITRGMAFTEHHRYPGSISVCRIKEDHEPQEFKSCFCDWREKPVDENSVTKSYNVGIVGRALFSTHDKRPIPKIEEHWKDDYSTENNGPAEVWRVAGELLAPITHDQKGIFHNGNCYIVLSRSEDDDVDNHLLYYWLGSKSRIEDRKNAAILALQMDEALRHKCTVIRILDGRENSHFMSTLQNSMVVYDVDCSPDRDNQMFCVRELENGGIRVHQVSPVWTSLNSSGVFVLITPQTCYLWYGKFSGGAEREYSKQLLSFLYPSLRYSYEVITEEKELPSFASVLGTRHGYPQDFNTKTYERRSSKLVCYDPDMKGSDKFLDMGRCAKEDLTEDSIYILDTFDQMIVWIGDHISVESRLSAPYIAEEYLTDEPAARSISGVTLCFVSQRAEPSSFTRHFGFWDGFSYGGKDIYEQARKRLRQENAKIDLEDEIYDLPPESPSEDIPLSQSRDESEETTTPQFSDHSTFTNESAVLPHTPIYPYNFMEMTEHVRYLYPYTNPYPTTDNYLPTYGHRPYMLYQNYYPNDGTYPSYEYPKEKSLFIPQNETDGKVDNGQQEGGTAKPHVQTNMRTKVAKPSDNQTNERTKRTTKSNTQTQTKAAQTRIKDSTTSHIQTNERTKLTNTSNNKTQMTTMQKKGGLASNSNPKKPKKKQN
ncbi:hypothetical protein ACJMK2_043589 [Sinanodonta woodiana]|uniref:Gelsolin-like domain-containing protein n=1 Tax=Sinanodonta woodiana TaxID=1069815 RepID=A0ABD3VXE8_SINWO